MKLLFKTKKLREMENVKSYEVTKQLIINTPIPIQTRTYKPVNHEQIINLTLEGISKAGFSLDKEIYSSAKDGDIASGRYVINNISDNEMKLQIMWRNSYNRSLPLTFSLGALILVCSNGMQVSQGLGSFKKKHQGEIQSLTPYAISEYIKNAENVFLEMQRERDVMKNIELSRTIQSHLIGKMFIEEQFIKSTQLNLIKKELFAPTYNYGDPNSLWSLYQYTTSSMREIHPSLYLQDHLDAHKFFVKESGLIIPEKKELSFIEIAENNRRLEDKRQLSLYIEYAKLEEV